MRADRIALAIVVALAGCGAANQDGGDSPPDGGGGADAGDQACATGILYAPIDPVAADDTRVRVEARVDNAPGVLPIRWTVLRGATQIPFEVSSEGRVATFAAPIAATYDVFMDVLVSDPFCPQAHVGVEVKTPGAGQAAMRLHVVAPAAEQRPPYDARVIVDGGATDTLPDVVVAAGDPASGTVLGDGAPVAAYLKFLPETGEAGFVEAFAGPSGSYAAVLRPEHHRVLVVPLSSSLAPRIVDWQPGVTELAVDGGTAIAGVVRDGAGAALAGAKVQLVIDGVRSTLDTTAGDGSFTVHAVPVPGATVTIEVTPPADRGLPRLVATSTTFALDQPLAIQFADLGIREVAGAVVRRGGAAVGGARVSILGTIADAGTIGGVAATGEVRIVAEADASGVLATTRAPAVALTAVIEAAAGDFAVRALDLAAGAPPTIDAPAMIQVATTIRDPADQPVPHAVLEAIPRDALQLAGAPPLRVVADADGAIATRLAAGGAYDLRLSDPANRSALRTVSGAAAPLPATLALAPATQVTVRVVGDNPIRGAVVQLRCADCTGVDASRAIAEGVTGIDGRVTLAAPAP